MFYTDSGRPVRDAGGIEPDVELPAPKAYYTHARHTTRMSPASEAEAEGRIHTSDD